MLSRTLTRTASVACSFAGLTLLAGCVIDAPAPGGGLTPRRTASAVEGNWGDTGGVATSRFRNGAFTSYANDTGNPLAQGSYRYVDSRTIEINFTSLVRQQQVRTNCLLVNNTQMNCTSNTGSQFTLVRRA
ncbi:hypothetical protein [Oricola cellulosilytica]|uniref:Outer membrane lipoprotein omp10 n=1 Tax=Oricola cellulosilytica TaxID=1429082 RepID=A0A4R0P7I3_9HYPH|nr:hypothetical protein [Oricola cellulosilytica]TCD11425.1 hypothetical protein E0D97_17140 [Oricola cellulosilytica]